MEHALRILLFQIVQAVWRESLGPGRIEALPGFFFVTVGEKCLRKVKKLRRGCWVDGDSFLKILEGKFGVAFEQIDHAPCIEKVGLFRFESERLIGVIEGFLVFLVFERC